MDDAALAAWIDGVVRGDRALVARAITLVESSAERDRIDAERLLEGLAPHVGRSVRVGITGVPGAGKSTFLDALGRSLVARGHRLGVLAIDPSSQRRGGSILGDKTRMGALARETAAFIRPSPSRGALGGVADATRDALFVLEAAGFDVVFVETVGVGQSETLVAELVDTFVWLTIPNAGDELQGIKRGIMERADVVVVNKADGDRVSSAELARLELVAALHLLPSTVDGWSVPVLLASAREERGLDAVWDAVLGHRARSIATGAFEARRRDQRERAFDRALDASLRRFLAGDAGLRARIDEARARAKNGHAPSSLLAREIVALLASRLIPPG